jgi:2-C-methyl-D-erythritol 2,4-cyclodiphosphate synthase
MKKGNKSKNEAGNLSFNFRVGLGFDIHKFSQDKRRKLILGQVKINHVGLEGASDADVLLHAICDAILGATIGKDIGTFFPPEKSKGISSKEIAQKVMRMIEDNFKIINIDGVIIAEKPKLSPFIPKMIKNIKKIFRCDVNIKAKNPEGVGNLNDGIASIATCLVEKINNKNKK